MAAVTELEKTILLVLMTLSRGNSKKLLQNDAVLVKFPIRQRKEVRSFVEKLSKKGLINKKDDSLGLTQDGLKQASKILLQGAKIRV